MKEKLFLAALCALAVLHHDYWLWDDARLALGFLPAGLAYHAGFSVATALVWLAGIRYCWPSRLVADDSSSSNPAGASE